MYKGKTILGIIPARGKSKALPHKNIKPIRGKPLIAWTINAARKSRYLDRVIVSTEDETIRQIARNFRADTPFLRPKHLATDNAKTIDVIFHALNWLEDKGELYDLVILLQPTSCLRLSKDIDNSIELLFSKEAKSIVSVCEVEHHPHWANTLPKDHSMERFLNPKILNKNRQALPRFYRLNGAIYLAYTDYVKRKNGFFGKETLAYIMPKDRSIDIDEDLDFRIADFLLRSHRGNVV